jgi:hypothetical protein
MIIQLALHAEWIQIEYPLSEMFGTYSVIDFFQTLEYLHIHNVVSSWWDTHLNIKFTHVSCMSYTRSLKVILYDIFYVSEFWLLPINEVWNFLPVMLNWCSKYFSFLSTSVFDFKIMDVQESLLLFTAWRTGNVCPFFSPISPYFYPVIVNFFINKLCYCFSLQKKIMDVQPEFWKVRQIIRRLRNNPCGLQKGKQIWKMIPWRVFQTS